MGKKSKKKPSQVVLRDVYRGQCAHPGEHSHYNRVWKVIQSRRSEFVEARSEFVNGIIVTTVYFGTEK